MNQAGELTFMGFPVHISPCIPDETPVLELSYNVDVSPEFRAKCNSLYLRLFGTRPYFLMIGNNMIASPNNMMKLKKQAIKVRLLIANND